MSNDEFENLIQEWSNVVISEKQPTTVPDQTSVGKKADPSDSEADHPNLKLNRDDSAFLEDDAETGLTQAEIDSLLGVDSHDEENKTGFSLLTDTKNIGENKYILLDVIYERLVRRTSASLRKFSSDNIDINLDKTKLIRFGDYLNSIPLPAMIGVFRAEEWDNYGLITLKSDLIYSILEILLGGHRSRSSLNRSRAYTRLDVSLVEKFVNVILDDLVSAFDPIYPVNIRLERIETNPRFASFTLASNVSHQGTFVIDIDDRGGSMEIVLPLSTIEPVREILTQSFLGEKFGQDPIWEKHFRNSLKKTHVRLDCILTEHYKGLKEVKAWKVGDVIELDLDPRKPIMLSCNGRKLFDGIIGSTNQQLAVKVNKKVPYEKRVLPQQLV